MKIYVQPYRQPSACRCRHTIALSSVALSTPAHAIVPNDNYTPDEIVDTDEEFAGVGQFYRNDGFVCTGTLINPRTVLFAAQLRERRTPKPTTTRRSVRHSLSTLMPFRASSTGSTTASPATPTSPCSTSTASITIPARSPAPTGRVSLKVISPLPACRTRLRTCRPGHCCSHRSPRPRKSTTPRVPAITSTLPVTAAPVRVRTVTILASTGAANRPKT